MGIDPERQQVLLSDGEVGDAVPCRGSLAALPGSQSGCRISYSAAQPSTRTCSTQHPGSELTHTAGPGLI